MSADNSFPASPQKLLAEITKKIETGILTPSKRINQPTPFSSPTLVQSDEITPGITAKEYARRRHETFDRMVNNSILILPSAPQKYMSPDIVHRFRQDPDFLYLTGFIEPSAICCLYKETKNKKYFYLFVTEYDPKQTTYQGHIAGTETAKTSFNADKTFDISDINKSLKELIDNCKTVYFNILSKTLTTDIINFKDILLHSQIETIISKCNHIKKTNLKKIGTMIEKLRLIKSHQEIKLMKESSKIAAISMKEMIQCVTPGIIEDRLASMFEFGCRMRGAIRLSAPVTISHGHENNILHYLNNDRIITDGTLCLMDTGAEYFGYASDITRVFPTNGIYTEAQLQIYNLVLKVQQICIEKHCIIGSCIKKLDIETDKLLREGLEKLNILIDCGEKTGKKKNNTKLNIDEMWHSGGVHFVSHWIGMDIHDCNDIGHRTKFESGMCIAVEPGIYLPDHENIKPQYRNIGIRIEDTVLITNNGCDVLTKDCPKDPYIIMELMKSSNNKITNDRDLWKNAKEGLWSPKTKKQVRIKLSDNVPFWN
eukprot:500144_1